jgi:hypothetical protein
MWIYTSTPHTPSWRSAYLVKRKDNFTFFIVLKGLPCSKRTMIRTYVVASRLRLALSKGPNRVGFLPLT